MLDTYFRRLASVMAEESRALGEVYRHPGKLGENREALLARFFRDYLPKRFGVSTGFALVGSGLSTQQDVVIYDRINNPILFADTAAPLFPPSALAATIEVKSKLDRRELADAIGKAKTLKRELRASFAHHPAPPRSEALAVVFAFESTLAPAQVLAEAKRLDDEQAIEMCDRLDGVCVLGDGLVLGGSLMYSTTHGGDPLLFGVEPPRQQRLAIAVENTLFVLYSRLLDYIMGRGDVRPQLMSYMPPDTPLGNVVAIG